MIPLQHKAAGHDGPMQTEDGSLFIKPTSQEEIAFYDQVQAKKVELQDDLPYGSYFADWIPQYMGVLYPGASDDLIGQTNGNFDEKLLKKATDTLEIEGENKQYLILNNCLYGFSEPCIMDIKLGSILYDSNASEEKIKRMKLVSQQTTSGSLNFRIAGMKVKDNFENKFPNDLDGLKIKEVCKKSNGYLTFNKYFGRKLSRETVADGLRIFFRYNKLPRYVQDTIIENFHARLQMLYNCLLDEELRIISGSLLFVFENDIKRWEEKEFNDPIVNPPLISEEEEDEAEEEDTELLNTPLSILKFIDFAHAKYTPGKGYDEEIVSGIENLFEIIETV